MAGTQVCTVPDARWLEELGPFPDGVRGRVWAVDRPPADVLGDDAVRVTMVVWPHVAPAAAQHALPALPALRRIQVMSAGHEHLSGLVPPGVTVSNASTALAASTSELCLTLLLACQRGIPRAVRQGDQGVWEEFSSDSLADRTVLLVGAGEVGTAIAQRLQPFEVALTRVARTGRAHPLGRIHAMTELAHLVPEHEVVVLALPLTSGTRGLVDNRFLARMKDGALLVNVGRGAVVRTDALVTELQRGRLRAALDVVDPEPLPADHALWRAPGVLITPHVGGSSSAVRRRVLKLLRGQIERLARGEPPTGVVTFGPTAP